MKSKYLFIFLLALTACAGGNTRTGGGDGVIRTLIVDGQNNHDHWPKTTYMMKKYLEETGKFSVDVRRSRYTWKGEKYLDDYMVGGGATQPLEKAQTDPDFRPDFSQYDLVVSNFGWNAAPWPAETRADFEEFVRNGGGVVVVHAANNSFPDWTAYNEMIALGGWGDRTEKDGPYVYYDDEGKMVRDIAPGKAGSHGDQQEFVVTVRDPDHPITRGMPRTWMHAKDELYAQLRGPAKNMKVLATAYSSKDNKGTNRNEPMLMTITYGKGRIFHNAMGHADYSVESVGFITTLLRGAEWAATGKVTIPIPADFPTAEKSSSRPFEK